MAGQPVELTLTNASTRLPVEMEEAKDHLRVTSDRYLGDLRGKIRGATDFCQRQVSGFRQFMSATYTGTMRSFPLDNGPIEFPMPPLQGTPVVTYITSTGGSTTLSSTAYTTVNPTETPGFIEPVFGKTWPSTRDQANAVTLIFVAGYAATRDVPDSIKQAVLLKTEHLWDPERVDEKDMKQAVMDLMNGHEYGHYT